MIDLSSHRSSVDDHDDSACPNCGGHGLARALTIKEYQQTISYECESCHYKWSSGTDVPTEKLSYPKLK